MSNFTGGSIPGTKKYKRERDKLKAKLATREFIQGAKAKTNLGVSKKIDVPKTDSKRYNRKEEDASRGSKTGPFGGPNPFRKKIRTFGDDLKAGNQTFSSKSSSSSKSKSEWKPTPIQKRLMEGGWTKEELQAKQAKHKKWKADRKAGKLKQAKWDPTLGRNQGTRLVPADTNKNQAKIKKRKRKGSGYQYKSNVLKSLNK